MPPTYFTPHAAPTEGRARGCYACTHFHGLLHGGHVVCEHRGGVRVIGVAKMGCAYWQREPGADDE